MSSHRRRLPHQYAEGKTLFVTWHLHGSLPHGRYPPPGKLSSGQAFVWMDWYMDTAKTGPVYLRQEPVARLVVDSIRHGARLGHYDLHAYVVMANHVHLLAYPHLSPSRWLQSLKGYTARRANLLLGRTGKHFWQAESYDHWVRNDKEWIRIKTYIENNPVRAGLASRAADYPWSSAADPLSTSAEMILGAADGASAPPATA